MNDGIRYRQKLAKLRYKDLILELYNKGKSYTQITELVNKRLRHRTYAYQLQKAIEETGQVYNGTHGIRHSYAQNKLEEGYTKQEVSEMMGHNREEITNTYLR